MPPPLNASDPRSCRTDVAILTCATFFDASLASTSSRTKLTSDPVSEVWAANDSCR